MIAIFPLLVSNTISKNIIPGVAKVLENYLMVYGLEGIMRRARGKLKVDYQIIANKKVVMKEMEDHLENFLYREMIEEQSSIGTQTGPGSKGKSKKPKDPDEDDEKQSHKVDMSGDLRSISLEPTWMKVEQVSKEGNKTSGIVGIKVVPYAVKSDASLSRLLSYDRQVSKLLSILIRVGRKTEGSIYRSWRAIWDRVPFTGKGDAVTGDPRKDILQKKNILRAGHVQDVFVLANQGELQDDFLTSAGGVLKLQQMGWGSLIVADDVNRRVSFCMKDMRGMCSVLPYTMLYQTFSQAKIYEDLEDAKRSASSIFKTKRNKLSKILGESVAQEKTIEFGRQNLPLIENDLLNEMYLIDENLGSFIKKVSSGNIKQIVSNVAKGKMKVPDISPDKIVRAISKINPSFKKSYMFSKKVLANSAAGVSESTVSWTAIFIAIVAVMQKGKDVMIATKDALKKFMRYFIRSKSKVNVDDNAAPNLPKEHYVEVAWGVATISLILTLITYMHTTGVDALKSWLTWFTDYKGGDLVNVDVGWFKTAATQVFDWGKETAEFGQQFAPTGVWLTILLIVAIKIWPKRGSD